MNENSLEAYEHIRQTLNHRQQQVANAILASPKTLNEVAQVLNVTPNTISGRIGELRKMGLIEPMTDADGKPVKRKSAAGIRCSVWRIAQKKEQEQLTLF